MNCIPFRYKSAMLLCTIFSFYIVMHLMPDSGLHSRNVHAMFVKNAPRASSSSTAFECVASNDFSLTHKNGKDESIQHTFVYRLQGEKLLRGCIFDREKILILTRMLIWFTHSTYQVSLPPVWHPSIPIAHRRLII